MRVTVPSSLHLFCWSCQLNCPLTGPEPVRLTLKENVACDPLAVVALPPPFADTEHAVHEPPGHGSTATHAVCVLFAAVPVAQGVQTLDPGEELNVLPVHVVQACAPWIELAVPAAHGVQLWAPAAGANVPEAQGAHGSSPVALNVPGAQSVAMHAVWLAFARLP
jgi:hypothetical protein